MRKPEQTVSKLCFRADRRHASNRCLRVLIYAVACAAFTLAQLSCSRYWYAIHGKRVIVAPETVPFRAGPYIQLNCASINNDAGRREYVIRWFDPVPVPESALFFGADPDTTRMSRAPEKPGGDGRLHEVRLASLENGRRYYYAIPGFDDTVRSFQTDPGPGGKARMLCVGDTENTASDRETMSYFGEVIAQAENFYRDNGGPVMMLHLGDLVKFGSDYRAWGSFFADSDSFTGCAPAMFALGNHEMKGDFGAHFDYFFSHPRYYSFDWGDAHVLVLHAFDGIFVSEDGPRVSSGMEQLRFAEQDLEKNRDRKWLIAAIHFPLFSTGDFNMNKMLIRQYRSLFKKYRVDLVLAGHDHSFDSFHADRDEPWGGTWYVVCGTGGSRLDGYVMTRNRNRWKEWSHDGNSSVGLYQDDDFTRENHVYGELSWGFVDLEISADELAVTYYRWLSFPDFLEATGQSAEKWDIVPLPSSAIKKYGLDRAMPVKRFTKRRSFQRDASR